MKYIFSLLAIVFSLNALAYPEEFNGPYLVSYNLVKSHTRKTINALW